MKILKKRIDSFKNYGRLRSNRKRRRELRKSSTKSRSEDLPHGLEIQTAGISSSASREAEHIALIPEIGAASADNIAPMPEIIAPVSEIETAGTENAQNVPENPEVSARLTNLSMRHTGSRPEWFDFDPLKLPGRTRQCNHVYWQITDAHRAYQKQMIVLHAGTGIGKTTFLSQLYSMLEHAPENVLTLAPGQPNDKPFQAIRNILEQRFYISGEATFKSIERFVLGAVNAIVRGADSKETGDRLLELWRIAKSTPDHAAAHLNPAGSDAPPAQSVMPPPIATQVVSMTSILDSHRQQETSRKTGAGDTTAITPNPLIAGESDDQTGLKDQTENSDDIQEYDDYISELEKNAQDNCGENGEEPPAVPHADHSHADTAAPDDAQDSDPQQISADIEIDIDEAEMQKPDTIADSVSNLEAVSKTTCHVNTCQCAIPKIEPDDDDDPKTEIIRCSRKQEDVQNDIPRASRENTPDKLSDDGTLRRTADFIKPALIRFIEEDLRRNPIVIVIDDIEKFDAVSIELLSTVFNAIPNSRITVLLTTGKPLNELPACLKADFVRRCELEPLSDTDLIILTKHIFKTLSQTREKLIVPQEICRQIARRAYGSPQRAIDMVLKYFTPELMIQWNSTLSKIRCQPLPKEIGHTIVERFKSCDEQEKFILHIASHLNAPFTVSTLKCILSKMTDRESADAVDCAAVFKRLKKAGFFERAEESFSQPPVTYVYRHDCERLVIAASTKKSLRQQIFSSAAQWYALNNPNHIYDEAIGDLWLSDQSIGEACRYYETAAYRAFRNDQYTKAWPLFRKLIKNLPEDNIAHKITVTLDSAKVAFRIGLVDEAFKLCRWSGFNARRICALSKAAEASIQIAAMLVELGSTRHVMRYIKRARRLLNAANDRDIETSLALVSAHYEICRTEYKKAKKHLINAETLTEGNGIAISTSLTIAWTAAVIEAHDNHPLKAIEQFKETIERAKIHGEMSICAVAYRALGNAYEYTDNLAAALESWNYALGIAQEMNDIVLHAALLADITKGAIALNALKTAKAAAEQCLAVAQQTKQKKLIAKCLAYTALFQYNDKQYDKSVRTLRKAHKYACAIKSVPIWTYTLSIIAKLYNTPDFQFYLPSAANRIYKNLIRIYERRDQPLSMARIMAQYAYFLIQTHQNMAALSICRKALAIYQNLQLEKASEKIQAIMDKISDDIARSSCL